MSKIAAIILLSIIYCSNALGYKNYTTANGLVNNTVYCVYKDSRGYLWFGTNNGISRFDGKHFLNYTTLNGLSDNNVLNFYEDKFGRLWLFTYNGSHCYIKNDSVFNAFNDTALRQIPTISYVRTMTSGDDSSLYIGYGEGTILKIKGAGYSIITKRNPAYAYLSSLHYLNGKLEVASGNALSQIKGNLKIKEIRLRFNVAFVFGNKILIAQDSTIAIYEDGNKIWEYRDSSIIKNGIISLVGAGDAIICCTMHGAFILNIKTKNKSWLLKNIAVTNACVDIYGNYWLSTLGRGVFSIKKEYENIRFLGKEDDTHIIKAANKQVFYVHGKHISYFNGDGEILPINIKFEEGYVPLCKTDSLFAYNTPSSTLLYNLRTRKTINLFPGKYKVFYTTSANSFVLSNGYTIERMSIKKDVVKNSFIRLDEKILAVNFRAYHYQFYFLTNTKLYSYNAKTDNLKLIDSFSRLQMPVNLFEFGRYFFVETNDNNLLAYDLSNGAKRPLPITVKNRMFYNIEALSGNNYIGYANNGYYYIRLNRLNILKSTFSKIEYPFNASEITEFYLLSNSILCNVDNGIYVFDQKFLNSKTIKPYLFIDNVQINGKRTGQSVTVRNSLSCNVLVSLNSLYFNNPEIKFQYRIKTTQKISQWYRSDGGDINILLPEFGFYTIEVQAITDGGINSDTRHIYVQWLPPLYLTWWFKGIVVLFALLLAAYSVYLFFKKRERAFANELSYLQLEFKAINSLINPHFIFNAINNIQNLVNRNDADEANEYLAMLSRLIRQNIDNLQFNLIPLQKELNLIRNYVSLQNLRFNGKIDLLVNERDASDDIYIPPLLIHSLVENAIVHGFKSQQANFRIVIDMKINDDYLFINVTDNGIGIKNSRASDNIKNSKTSLGLDFTKKRLIRLSDYYKVNYAFNILDLSVEGGVGTMASIMIYSNFKEFLSS